MKKLKILHLASFCGNIGDIASHNGLYNSILKNLGFEVTQLEMRLFYQNCKKRVFDEEFCDYVNTFDLMIIGGGGFLSIGFESSKTATTFDVERQVFDRIKIPIIFNSIGISEYVPATESMQKRFCDFMRYLISKDNVLIVPRNDNGMDILRKYLGNDDCIGIKSFLDCGFFADISTYFQPNLLENKINIAVNIAGDMLDVRIGDELKIEQFVDNVVGLLMKILSTIPDSNIIFVPHIIADLDIIATIMRKVPNEYSRYNMSVAPCLYQNENALANFDLYRKCNCVIAMRNHAAIVSLSQGCEVVGIGTLGDFKGIFQSLGLSENCIDIKDEYCFDKIYEKVFCVLHRKREIQSKHIHKVIHDKEEEMRTLYERWICEKCGDLNDKQ